MKSKRLKFLLIGLVAIAVLLGAGFVFGPKLRRGYESDRVPSSLPRMTKTAPGTIAHSKWEKLSHNGDNHRFGKVRAHLLVSLQNLSGASVEPGVPFTLRGEVTSSNSIAQLTAEWGLPDGVEVVSGPQKDTLSNLSPDQPKSIEITLVTRTTQRRQIFLEVYELVNGEKLGNVAQYRTPAVANPSEVTAKAMSVEEGQNSEPTQKLNAEDLDIKIIQ